MGVQAEAARTVAENTKAGQAIGNPVVAEDKDGDVLTYTLVDPTPGTVGDDAESFAIDWATGQLMTKDEDVLDFEAYGRGYRHLHRDGQGH